MQMARRISAAALTLACVVTAYSQTADGPPVPYEDVGACPFEGCVYREWQANDQVQIHAARRSDSPVVFRLAKGEKVQAVTGVVVTIKAGRAQFDKPQRLDTSSGPIDIQPGQTLFLLTYQGEGFTKAWFNGRVYTEVHAMKVLFDYGCEVVPGRCPGRIIEKPVREWWVQVRNASGQLGWTRETEKFGNKDAFG